MLQPTIIRGENDVTDKIKNEAFNLVEQCLAVKEYRQGGLMILNALLNTLREEEVQGKVAEITLDIVNSTIEGDFDNNVRKTAIGLVQDLTGNLQSNYGSYIERTVNLLTSTLKNDTYPPEVKMFTICAIGDLILVTED